MPLVHLLTTGGTIASRPDPTTGAAVPAVRADELLAEVPQLAGAAELRVEELGLHSSWNVTPGQVAGWARRIRALLADGAAAGAVVTHGTDTLEETAFALDLQWDGPAPIVVTGAMRNASEPGPDGPRNLLAAVRVAADPGARGRGVLVVLNDEVHAARHATKAHSTALGAFRSHGVGPVAILDGGGIWWRCAPARLSALPPCDPDPGVHLVKVVAGLDPLLFRALLDGGARGVVVEGTGTGNVRAECEPAIVALLEAGIPVVLASRTGGGRVLPAYGGAGGGRRLVDLGVIPAGDLSGLKARLALMFALGAGLDLPAIRAWFGRVEAGYPSGS